MKKKFNILFQCAWLGTTNRKKDHVLDSKSLQYMTGKQQTWESVQMRWYLFRCIVSRITLLTQKWGCYDEHVTKTVQYTFHYQSIIAGSLKSAYWLLRGAHSFLGNGVFGRFMISMPSLRCIYWLEFVYRMMWCHFGCTLWHHHFWNDAENENDIASCCVWRNFYFYFSDESWDKDECSYLI